MTVMGTLSSFREPGEMSPHKRASRDRCIAGEMRTNGYGNSIFSPSVNYWFCGTSKMSMCENRNSRGFLELSPLRCREGFYRAD
jgi:hypothetical protein